MRRQYFDLTVTAEDLRLGVLGNSHECAVTRALRREYPEAVSWNEGWRAEPDGPSVASPAALTAYADAFDAGSKRLRPRTFRVQRPPVRT